MAYVQPKGIAQSLDGERIYLLPIGGLYDMDSVWQQAKHVGHMLIGELVGLSLLYECNVDPVASRLNT